MPSTDFLRVVVEELVVLFSPLSKSLSDPVAFAELLRFHGWRARDGTELFESIESIVRVRDKLQQLESVLTRVSTTPDATLGVVLLSAFELAGDIVDHIQAWPQVDASQLPSPFSNSLFWRDFPVQLLDYLQARYIRDTHPYIYAPLLLTGIFEESVINNPSEGESVFRVRMRPKWSRIANLLEPRTLLSEVYGWGTSEFLFDEFILRLEQSCELAGFRARLRAPSTQVLDRYYELDSEFRPRILEAYIPLVGGLSGGDRAFETAVSIFPIPRVGDRHGRPVGVGISALSSGTAPNDGTLGVMVTVHGFGGDNHDVVLEIRPDAVVVAALDPVTSAHDVALAMSETDTFDRTLIGSPSGAGLRFESYSIALRARHGTGGCDARLELSSGDSSLVLDYESADSFLKDAVPHKQIAVPVPLTIGLSSLSGLYIGAPGTLSRAVIVGRSFGGFHVERANIALSMDGGVLSVETTIDTRIAMGPVQVSVLSTGARLSIDLSDRVALAKGSIEFGFKPPDGMGILVDAGPVNGGGFLSYDDTAGRYFGALELEVFDVGIKAIGILDTRLPGGRPAYSFLILVSAEFTPIPLGFGFNLIGVGGLFGIHRSVDAEALRARLGSGALDHILFPKSPVNDFVQIVSDLRAVFPPTEDHYIFGPTARISWGTSAIVEGKLGILLELSDGRIVLIGRVRAALPRPDDALVELNLDVFGQIDPQRALIELEGKLTEPSSVGPFKLGGDFAFRLVAGESPSFALAIGGFNEDYQPPPNFPTLERLTVPMDADVVHITLKGYLAITSNTFQIGAAVHVYAEASKFNIEGDVSFDVLFTFSPFSFIGDFSGEVALNCGDTELAGIHLEAKISGPAPWHAWGEACLVIKWCPDICVPFDTPNFGADRQIELPVQDPWPQLRAAIESAENWSSSRPKGAYRRATMTAASDSTNLLDPTGGLVFRQPVVPLGRRITRFGQTQPPGGADRFTVVEVVASNKPAQWSSVEDFFAPALFEELSDDEKLSRPSFERMVAGFAMANDAVNHGAGVGTIVDYETKIVDSAFETRQVRPYRPTAVAQLSSLQRASAAQAPLRHSGVLKFTQPVIQPLVAMTEERFIVASNVNLAQRTDIVAPATKGLVLQALAEHLASHPDQIGTLQVVSLDELAA